VFGIATLVLHTALTAPLAPAAPPPSAPTAVSDLRAEPPNVVVHRRHRLRVRDPFHPDEALERSANGRSLSRKSDLIDPFAPTPHPVVGRVTPAQPSPIRNPF
jgi:hypothetical protein